MVHYIPMNWGGHMKVLKGYVFRLCPNVEQNTLINKTSHFKEQIKCNDVVRKIDKDMNRLELRK